MPSLHASQIVNSSLPGGRCILPRQHPHSLHRSTVMRVVQLPVLHGGSEKTLQRKYKNRVVMIESPYAERVWVLLPSSLAVSC
jgi:hypothetical protein